MIAPQSSRKRSIRSDREYIVDLLVQARYKGASDLHIQKNEPPRMRIDGVMSVFADSEIVGSDAVEKFLDDTDVFVLSRVKRLRGDIGHCEARYSHEQTGPVRIEARRTLEGITLNMRLLSDEIPAIEALGLPPIVKTFPDIANGLILFTGPTGQGKSTSVASVLDLALDQRALNLITYEDPIEYMHKRYSKNGMPRRGYIDQVEIGTHIESYAEGLKSALRSDPDIIQVGEMRDQETIEETLRCADTGHLVFSTGHDQRASKTVERLVNSFPPTQSEQMRYRLAQTLRYVVSLRLLTHASGRGRVSCAEVMAVNDPIRALIKAAKIDEIPNAIGMESTSHPETGMQTLENALARLYVQGKITLDTALGEIDQEKRDQFENELKREKSRPKSVRG
jgi:twitching motility protein PilT